MPEVAAIPRLANLTDAELLSLYLSVPPAHRDKAFISTTYEAEVTSVSMRTIQLWIESGAVRANGRASITALAHGSIGVSFGRRSNSSRILLTRFKPSRRTLCEDKSHATRSNFPSLASWPSCRLGAERGFHRSWGFGADGRCGPMRRGSDRGYHVGGGLFLPLARATLLSADRGRAYQLAFSSDPEGWIEKLYVAEYRGDLVLIGGIDYGETADGFLMRLAPDGFSRRWLASIPGCNVGKALLRERYAYVSAIGFVGKLDLNTGRYAWQNKDLYSKSEAFNNFATPFAEGTNIVFVGEGGPWQNNEIVIDDRSGKILNFRSSTDR